MPKHHYVPQFYLERFGKGKCVSAVLMGHDFRFVERASIPNQSCKPDYYRYPEVESLFGQIEREASRLMQNTTEHIQLTVNDGVFLKMYVAFQMIRTPAFVQHIENHLSAGLSSGYNAYADKEGLEKASLPINIPDADVMLWSQMDMVSVVCDLDIRYLSSSREGFLTSDQPVVVYNPWALKGGFARNGLGCRGLMLFLPISGGISIMLYDSEVYSIRSRDRRSEFITIARDDEERLNKLQMVGNRSVLYLPRPDRHPEVQSLARKVRSAYPSVMNPPMVRWAKSDDGGSEVFSVEEQSVDFGNWRFLYESRDWRAVPLPVRGFGVYGSRDSTPDAGQRMLLNAHPWNSTRYTDDQGGVSYLRNHL